MTMSSQVVRERGWWIGAIGGLVVAVALGFGAQAYQVDREGQDRAALGIGGTDDIPAPVDMVRDLLAEEGQLVVHPELVERIKPEDLERARAILADAPSSPARRIAYAPRPDGLDVGYTNSGAIAQWMHAIGEEGHYVMVFDDGTVEVEAIGMESEYILGGAKGQPGPALVRVAEEAAEWSEELEESSVSDPSNTWEEAFDGVMGGLVLGAFTVVPLFFLLRWSVGRRRYKESR